MSLACWRSNLLLLPCLSLAHPKDVLFAVLQCPSVEAARAIQQSEVLVLQVKDDGYEIAHDGNCITVFSAPNYCDQMGNKGAFITFTGGDMSPQFTQFAAVPHPDVKPMAYASSMMGNMWGF